jgi:hypothetical protein
MIGSGLNLNHQTAHDLVTEELGMRTDGCCITTTLPVTKAISMSGVLTLEGIPVVPKPPYSRDQSPCDFLIFPTHKFHLKGHFLTLCNIQKVVTDQLRALPREDFQHCYREWERLQRCVASQGNYFEGVDVDFYFNC